MKFTRFIPAFLVTIIFLTGLWSCGPKKEETKSDTEFSEAEQSLKEQVQSLVYNLPPPTEIPYLLQQTGAEFNQTLINDRNKVDKYFSRNDKAALNLGIYAADIGYLTSYEKTQEAIDHLNAAKKLADNLGIVGSFNVDVLQRFETNIADKDSLASILNTAILSSDKYLRDESRTQLAAYLLTGSFVEGLYISTGLIKSYPKDLLPEDSRNLVLTPLMRVILQQEVSVDELLKMLASVEQDAQITAIVTDLTALQASYRALNIEEQIKNNRSDLVLTDKNLVEITSIVEKIRKSIVD